MPSVEDNGRGTQRTGSDTGCAWPRAALPKEIEHNAEKPEWAETWASYQPLWSSGTAAVYLLCLDIALNTDLCISLAILIILGLGHFCLCPLTHPWTKASAEASSSTKSHSSLHPVNTTVSAAVLMPFLCLRSTRTSFTWAPYFSPKTPSAELKNSFIPSNTSEKPSNSSFGSRACSCQAWAHGRAAAWAFAHQLPVPHVQPRASEPSQSVLRHLEQILHFWAPSHVSCRAPQEMVKIDYTSSHFWKKHCCLKCTSILQLFH